VGSIKSEGAPVLRRSQRIRKRPAWMNRKVVPNYAKLVKPLSDLMARMLKPRKPSWEWTQNGSVILKTNVTLVKFLNGKKKLHIW
jgi:hypothetical protein